MDIKRLNDLAQSILEDYKHQANGTKRWLQDYRKETQAYKEYRGREIFELLQNADDAQSDSVEIKIDRSNHILNVINSGDKTIPFNEDGIQSIMLSDLSPKKGKRMIGAKGLGFRSVLNWTDRIEIRSDNVSLRFDNDIVERLWHQLKDAVTDASRYEREAVKDERKVPLAILALPEIAEIGDHGHNSTSIILKYDKEYEQGIINDLENFQPESLLFLHYIKQVSISVNGEQIKKYSKQLIKNDGSIIESELNGKHWIQSLEKGALNGSDDEYEVSCAFCLDEPHESYNIFSFFPTQIEFPLPCILHATLNLDSSRNALLPGNKSNMEMISRLAERISIIADYLKHKQHDWYPYKLMRPDNTKPIKNEYIGKLISTIHELSADGAYIPTLDDRFANEDGYYYYSDEIFQFVKGNGADIFAGMRLDGAPANVRLLKSDLNRKNNVEKYALRLNNFNKLAEFIVRLLHYHSSMSCKSSCLYEILREDNGSVIQSTAYINTGMKVDEIPDFCKIRYVANELVSELKKLLSLREKKNPDRDLEAKLTEITNVSSTDVSVVTKNLLPKKNDGEKLTLWEKEELTKCLFKLFTERGKENFAKGEVTTYLMSESNEWLPANTLVITDSRFPNGFNKLRIEYTYQPNESVKYPDFLESIAGANPDSIQDFYVVLGAKLYLKTEDVYYGDDSVYLSQLNLKNEVIQNCKSWRDCEKRNTANVANTAMLISLDLHDLIKVITVSSYSRDVCGNQHINWYLNSYKTPEVVSVSYAAYLLRNITVAKQLRYYAIEDDEWLPGIITGDRPLLNLDYSTKILLEKLGAKKYLSDFSAEELYDAINQQEKLWLHPYTGAQVFYHSVKQALDSKKESVVLPKDKTLRMLCQINNSYEFRDSREVYYTDNNELPDDVVKNLPMLVMKRREGEQKVKKIFGCRTLKDIQVNINQKDIKENVTKELNARIEKRKSYLLAFASGGVGRRGANITTLFNDDVKRQLTSFGISVVNSIDYYYDIGNESLLKTKSISMADGELLYASQEPYICSQDMSLSSAMLNPRFNSAVVEALCIKLNLSSGEIEDRFYRIFTSSDRELDYYRMQEIEPALWNECENQFGMTHTDVAFWRKVFDVNDISWDESALYVERISYLMNKLNIESGRLIPDNFYTYHLQQLKIVQSKYVDEYLCFIYHQIEDDWDLHKEYLQRQAPFKSDKWLHDILKQNDNEYHIYLDYDGLLKSEMGRVFSYTPCANIAETIPTKRVDYLQGIDEFNLSDEGNSLLYFDGHKEYFDKLRAANDDDSGDVFSMSKLESEMLPINEFQIDANNPLFPKQTGGSMSNGGNHHKHKISNKRKLQLGNEAEDRVYNSLLKSDEYEIGTIYSSHLSNTGGNDSQGYDLEYRKKGETLFRCLEIKHSDGESIILTNNEYSVSQRSENKDRYDLALVTNNEIQIIRNAFADSVKFTKVANDYTVYFATTKL